MLIERPLTPEEKKDTILPNSVDCMKVFRYKLTEHEQNCTKEKTPFCRRCAYMDFEKQLNLKRLDMTEQGITPLGTEQELIQMAREFTFDKYTGKKYFNIHSIARIEEPIFVDFNKVIKHTANWVNYECKGGNNTFKHPLSLRVEIDKWNEWESKNLNKDEKKTTPSQ